MRVEVPSSRRTWLLLLLAVALAGFIATWRVAQRVEQTRTPSVDPDVVDIEVATD